MRTANGSPSPPCRGSNTPSADAVGKARAARIAGTM